MTESQAAIDPHEQPQIATAPNGSDMRFDLLGPVRALRDGTPLDLGPAKQVAVLAALLVCVDRFHEAVAEARKARDDGDQQAALDAHDRACLSRS